MPLVMGALSDVWVAEQGGAPVGFCMLRGHELYQLYVDRAARGSGLAARLLAFPEGELRRRGARTTWLTCAIGNLRAARFYEKHVWHRTGVITDTLSTTAGRYALEVWRCEKDLGWGIADSPTPSHPAV